jgi:hypothetical protein
MSGEIPLMKTFVLNTLPCEKLCAIVGHFGHSAGLDPTQTRALMNDYCGESSQSFRREIFALIVAIEEQVPSDLLAHANQPMEMAVARLSKRLQDERGLDTDLANWTVAAWALALGIWDDGSLSAYLSPLISGQPSAHPPSPSPTRPPRTRSTSSQTSASVVPPPFMLSQPPVAPGAILKVPNRTQNYRRVAAICLVIGIAASCLGGNVWRQSRNRDSIDRSRTQNAPTHVSRTLTTVPDAPREIQLARNIINTAVARLIILQSKAESRTLEGNEARKAQGEILPQLQQAAALSQQVIDRDRQDQQAWELHARALYYLGEYSQTEACVTDALRLFPGNSNLPTLRTRIRIMKDKQSRSRYLSGNSIPEA